MSRELLKRAKTVLSLINMNSDTKSGESVNLYRLIEAELAKPEPELFEIEWPDYHYQGMGCGLEDRSITDRYEAMHYGWDCALDRISEILPDELYLHPPAQLKPAYLSDSEVDFIISSPWLNKIARETYTEFAREIEQAVLKANGLIKGDL